MRDADRRAILDVHAPRARAHVEHAVHAGARLRRVRSSRAAGPRRQTSWTRERLYGASIFFEFLRLGLGKI